VKELILASYPNAKIQGATAKQRGGFEVTVNGKLIHSKSNGDGLVSVSQPDPFITKLKNVVEG
jgi:selT/selW/selH-like putative selenoprotein